MDAYALQQQKNRKLNDFLRKVVADGKRAAERTAKCLEEEKKQALERKLKQEIQKDKKKKATINKILLTRNKKIKRQNKHQ